jgi:penicillin-binding protein 1C
MFKKQHKKIGFIRKRDIFLGFVALGMLTISGALLWAAALPVPDITAFETRQVVESTRIYDRTGEILLYSVHRDVRRTVIEKDEMSPHIRNATVAIEDHRFFTHPGVDLFATARAVFANIRDGNLLGGQGGSTITQQLIKNSLLTDERSISRKVKEWILALRLEGIYGKDEILTTYLNEIPYGGNIYGIEEAAQAFFGKSARDLTIAESAYLAALPQAPTFLSPHGNNVEALRERKNTVLLRMYENRFITREEYKKALEEEVSFVRAEERGIKAPHFVMYILEHLERTYGAEAVRKEGFKVITTLDYELQREIEEKVYTYIRENQGAFDMENASVVVTDPNTGQILVMIGSRGYFDDEIDGAVNVAMRPRQPGSTFKPFAYVTAFKKGFTPDTVVFDLRTQFSTNCEPFEIERREYPCFSPENYDFNYVGPVTMREALAASKNVPAVKTLYLAGIRDSIQTAKSMGITTLDPVNNANLSLVLGSGEVRLLEMTNAYGVFANGGIFHRPVGILEIRDGNGKVVERFEDAGVRVIPRENALQITEILADRNIRINTFGAGTALDIPDPNIALKTGTTSNHVDVWTIGYNTNMVLGVWGGNNDGSPIVRRISSYIIAPLWREILDAVVERYPSEQFKKPDNDYSEITKPILTGSHWGGVLVDGVARGQAVHSILHWVYRNNPRGPVPERPENDPQYRHWEYPVRLWVERVGAERGGATESDAPRRGDEFLISGLVSTYKIGEVIEFSVTSSERLEYVTGRIGTVNTTDSYAPYEIHLETDGLGVGTHTLTITGVVEDGRTLTRSFAIELED